MNQPTTMLEFDINEK